MYDPCHRRATEDGLEKVEAEGDEFDSLTSTAAVISAMYPINALMKYVCVLECPASHFRPDSRTNQKSACRSFCFPASQSRPPGVAASLVSSLLVWGRSSVEDALHRRIAVFTIGLGHVYRWQTKGNIFLICQGDRLLVGRLVKKASWSSRWTTIRLYRLLDGEKVHVHASCLVVDSGRTGDIIIQIGGSAAHR
jgi:hypothetical protein